MSQEEKKITKLKLDDIEYNFDDLPKEAKNLINGLKTVDLQLKMYSDTINLLNISKNSMLQEMKTILEDIQAID